jgi:hypothetical protein
MGELAPALQRFEQMKLHERAPRAELSPLGSNS